MRPLVLAAGELGAEASRSEIHCEARSKRGNGMSHRLAEAYGVSVALHNCVHFADGYQPQGALLDLSHGSCDLWPSLALGPWRYGGLHIQLRSGRGDQPWQDWPSCR